MTLEIQGVIEGVVRGLSPRRGGKPAAPLQTVDTEKYKMGWLVVTFDLPVIAKKQRKAATDFRNFLLDDGYQMVQFSVYARACVTFARQETHIDRVKKHLLRKAVSGLFFVTRSQWERSYVIQGSPAPKRKRRTYPNRSNSGNGARAVNSATCTHRVCSTRFGIKAKLSFKKIGFGNQFALPVFGIKAKLVTPV